jgi:hypothetical protein
MAHQTRRYVPISPASLAPLSPVADRDGVPNDMKSRFHGAPAYWKRSFIAQSQRAETGINYVNKGKTGTSMTP